MKEIKLEKTYKLSDELLAVMKSLLEKSKADHIEHGINLLLKDRDTLIPGTVETSCENSHECTLEREPGKVGTFHVHPDEFVSEPSQWDLVFAIQELEQAVGEPDLVCVMGQNAPWMICAYPNKYGLEVPKNPPETDEEWEELKRKVDAGEEVVITPENIKKAFNFVKVEL